MKIVWDEPKRRANLEKHGFDFADVSELDWENAIIEDGRPDADGRRRLKAIGYFRDGTAAVVFALLGSEAISIISFRPANDRERRRLPWPPKTRP
ncbi:BrnT family toxin [Ciceribacter sp. L1K22]|uniref:BrnT family toxin n=1 Tax=Ciceribacter sp. L1K22 TaxID=2820275 RepID=UPI001ABE4852|nr:BrnT family toxin [Ciceribacter sp. L1K22]MBO3761084.1 BrnT family toxin [Ciceribacter sp. L1K22]